MKQGLNDDSDEIQVISTVKPVDDSAPVNIEVLRYLHKRNSFECSASIFGQTQDDTEQDNTNSNSKTQIPHIDSHLIHSIPSNERTTNVIQTIEKADSQGLISYILGNLSDPTIVEEIENKEEPVQEVPQNIPSKCKCNKNPTVFPNSSKKETEFFECPDLNPGKMNTSDSLLPDPLEEDKDKICLILDLDETLIHSSFNNPDKPSDFEITIGNDDGETVIYVAIVQVLLNFLKNFLLFMN